MHPLAAAQQQADRARQMEVETRTAFRSGALPDLLARRAEAARKAMEEWRVDHGPPTSSPAQ